MNWLVDLDRLLFAKINLDWTNPFFDWFFPSITDLHKNPLSLLGLIPLLFLWYRKDRRLFANWLVVLVISIGLADLISYRVIKGSFHRERPEVAGVKVQLRSHSHTGPSFPSNHTANVFAAATVLSAATPPLWPVYFALAACVGYSRVYVGVHFPSDVIAGGLLGSLLGLIAIRIFRFWLSKRPPTP